MLHQLTSLSGNSEIRIIVVGVGGTGSHLIPILAKYNYHLRSREFPGFELLAFDDDIIEHHNIGRQNFSPFQVGLPKASTIIESVNRYYGFNWVGSNMMFPENYALGTNAIIISCVDSPESRFIIDRLVRTKPTYWIDAGNGFDFGQIIIGYGGKDKLPNVIEEFPDIKRQAEKNEGAGCNDDRQGLFVNMGMAYYTAYVIKRMIDDLYLDFRGIYLQFGNDLNINFLR